MVEQLHGTALSDISLFPLCMCVSRFQGPVGAATVADSGGPCTEVNSTDVDSVVVSLVYSHELCTEICPSLHRTSWCTPQCDLQVVTFTLWQLSSHQYPVQHSTRVLPASHKLMNQMSAAINSFRGRGENWHCSGESGLSKWEFGHHPHPDTLLPPTPLQTRAHSHMGQ
ncbi:hypothetical protein C0Q70_13384 [Pomacea canaliculata]|uniref:Uncharacterized protein n=1 Tax=Pomacea canaliculata TaxID=400727 RepID=A0A2T7NX40_POMCA|nr:hypothetical protein C0Q70_13384 [Pomacea canaliculata]